MRAERRWIHPCRLNTTGTMVSSAMGDSCTHRDTFKSYRWNRIPGKRDRPPGKPPGRQGKRGNAKGKKRIRVDQENGSQPDKSGLAGRCRPVRTGVAANDKRKNRKSHRSQRNGLTKTLASILFSRIPRRLDRWICLLPHSGHCMTANLRMQKRASQAANQFSPAQGGPSVSFWTPRPAANPALWAPLHGSERPSPFSVPLTSVPLNETSR